MSKAETLRQYAEGSTAARVAALVSQVETLRQAKHQSVEELAAALEPIAQAMAKLTDDTQAALGKRGVTYEQGRDLEAVRGRVDRGAGGGAGQPGRDVEAGQAPERGGTGRGAGADRAGDGQADRRH